MFENAYVPNPDRLPPHSDEAEQAALGCVLLAWMDPDPRTAAAEGDALLMQLRPKLFYDPVCRTLHDELAVMRMQEHALVLPAVASWLKDRGKLDMAGGLAFISGLPDKTPSFANFSEYLRILREKAYLRFQMARATKTLSTIHETGKADDVRAVAEETWELEQKQGQSERPLIEWMSVDEILQYKVDPKSFLVGADIICRGDLTVIAGKGGLGKSMLGNTLAIAGAKGSGQWMGYDIRNKFRTAVLQSENSVLRIQNEFRFGEFPQECKPSIVTSRPTGLDFGNPRFRAELTRKYQAWPFDLLIIDNWLDVSRAEGQEDYLKALADIRSCLPMDDTGPAIVVLAHLRKTRGGDVWRPKVGRALADEISGSMALVSKARTVFVLQPTHDDNDGQLVFCLAKSNNSNTDADFNPTCWQRQPCQFKAVPNWDMEAWLNPPEDGGSKKTVTEDLLRDLFDCGRRSLTRNLAVHEIMEKGFAQQTAYKALSLTGRFADKLSEQDGLLKWAHV